MFIIKAWESNLLMEIDKTKEVFYKVNIIDTCFSDKNGMLVSNGRGWIPLAAVKGIKVNPSVAFAIKSLNFHLNNKN